MHCEFSDWSPWADCDEECGPGMQERDRYETVKEQHGGELCVHPCAKLTHKIAAAAAAAAGAATAVAAKISARRRLGKKNQDFYENLENEKIAKNIEKHDKHR